MRVVLTESAEQAVARVMTTLAMGGPRGSSGRAGIGRMEPTRGILLSDPRHSMVLPHITAIAEEFSRRMLILSSYPLMDLTRPMHRELWTGAAARAEGTWGAHQDAWAKWHNLKLIDAPDFAALDAFVEARNAIMHGLGRLTRLQTQKGGGKAAIGKLKSVGITMNGLTLVIVPNVLVECAKAARGFIEWLDIQVTNRALLAT